MCENTQTFDTLRYFIMDSWTISNPHYSAQLTLVDCSDLHTNKTSWKLCGTTNILLGM